ncbi:MAG: DsbA family oxidoreductase [Pseudomonadales bacterium]|nr:DsbA family oxidoreductase [Pseudomonadales bacterium]
MKTLKIEMIHDLVCSWCPIGYANLQQALNNLNIEADMHFLPSELNPGMAEKGESIDEHLAQRYGWSEAKRKDYRRNLLAVAEEAGVTMDFSKRTHYYNTNQAHKLMHWSEGHRKQQAMNELLIDAYFKRGLDISNTQILLDLAEQLGLDRSLAEKALASDEVSQALLHKQKRVQKLGLSSVPAFIFNENTLVSGSNSVEYFEQTLIALTQKEVA